MLSVRNAILAAALLLVLAIFTSIVGMLQTPDSGGMGRDSYGTRAGGYRGLYEVLGELEIQTQRRLAPPEPEDITASTLALLSPDPGVVGYEPTYLQRLLPWIEEGGRLVVAPSERDPPAALPGQDAGRAPGLLEVLELEAVGVVPAGDAAGHRRRRSSPRIRTAEEIAGEIMEGFAGEPPPLIEVPVHVHGPLQTLAAGVGRLTIPEGSVMTLAIGEAHPPDGTIEWTDGDGVARALVARFPRGSGEVIVVSDPLLLTNRLLAGSDNSVLAVRLLSPEGEAVQFDEFYHGLGVRGSPLYLLTRVSYATVATGLLLLLGVWTWRTGVFLGPPLPDQTTSRRDISEYINAMGRFFATGHRGRPRLVQQVRDGVLRQISEEVGLPPDTSDVERIAAALARHDVPRSEMLLTAARAVDDQLRTRGHWSESQTLNSMQRMTDCLSKNTTARFAPNWRRSSSVRTR
jgi:hypothetical protein